MLDAVYEFFKLRLLAENNAGFAFVPKSYDKFHKNPL